MPATLVDIDLGTVAFGDSISFDIPPQTLGFTAIAEVTDPILADKVLGIESITSPSGAQMVKNYWLPPVTQTYFFNSGIVIEM